MRLGNLGAVSAPYKSYLPNLYNRRFTMTKLIRVALICSTCVYAQVPGRIVIRDARIVTVSGRVIEKGTVVHDGHIEAVGANVIVTARRLDHRRSGSDGLPGAVRRAQYHRDSGCGSPSNPTSGRSGGVTRAPTTAPATPPLPRSEGPEDRPATTSWSNAADLIQTTDRRIESFRGAGFTPRPPSPSAASSRDRAPSSISLEKSPARWWW